jgi:hypothetical protein
MVSIVMAGMTLRSLGGRASAVGASEPPEIGASEPPEVGASEPLEQAVTASATVTKRERLQMDFIMIISI